MQAVSVTLLEEDSSRGCSARASVSPAKSGAGAAKVQSVVTAEDVNSPGHILRSARETGEMVVVPDGTFILTSITN